MNSLDNTDKTIRVEKDMESVSLTISQAIPCGLLLNELITNCYKHAFTEQKEGTIHISLKKNEGQLALSVKDNGKGLPADFVTQSVSTLGMTLVNTLVRQLDGDLPIDSTQGSSFTITFRIQH